MPTRPNLLFLFSDQQHWQAVGYRDTEFQTPHLDALAAHSTVFNRAYCTTPQCSPSRSSIMTGHYPTRTGVRGNIGAAGGEPLRQPTIGKTLQDAGYHTGYFGKWHLGEEAIAIAGWDDSMGPGSDNEGDAEAVLRAQTFLENAPADKPFALFVSINDPHDVYHIGGLLREGKTAPESAQTLPRTWVEQDFAAVPPVHEQFMTDDQGKIMTGQGEDAWKLYRELYRQKVQLMDQHFGDVLAALQASGRAGETAIIATSDHGDMDGQHRLIFKGPFMYDHMLRVPLTIQLPGQTERREVDFPTINVDLAPTLADLASAELTDIDGLSLLPLLTAAAPAQGEGATTFSSTQGEGNAPSLPPSDEQNADTAPPSKAHSPSPPSEDLELPERDFIVAEYHSKQRWVNPIRTIITDRYKLSVYRSGEEELYDQQTDPEELNNLAANSTYTETRRDLAAQLSVWLAVRGDNFLELQLTDREGNALMR